MVRIFKRKVQKKKVEKECTIVDIYIIKYIN